MKKIREYRMKANLSQGMLAEKLNVKQPSVSQWFLFFIKSFFIFYDISAFSGINSFKNQSRWRMGDLHQAGMFSAGIR